jgi:hypothetical protein
MPTTFAPIGFGAASSTDPAASAAGSVQPIKIGINLGGNKKKAPAAPTDGIIPISHKNVLGDDDEERDPGKDSVLLSRSELLWPFHEC